MILKKNLAMNVYNMVSRKSSSLCWFTIYKFDDVTSSNDLKYKRCSTFEKYSKVLKSPNGRIVVIEIYNHFFKTNVNIWNLLFIKIIKLFEIKIQIMQAYCRASDLKG